MICGIEFHEQVVATGGSAVYSQAAMDHLRQNSVLVYLSVSLETLQDRIRDYSQRGLAGPPGQSLAELFAERLPLYKRHADITVECDGLDTESVLDQVLGSLSS